MNRNTKFRVWDRVDKKWLSEDNFCIYLGHAYRIESGATVINSFGDSYNPLEIESDNCGIPFKDENLVIQQFTNFKDINGKEIYEGDIMKYTPSYEESMGGQVGPDINVVNFEYGCFYVGNTQLNEYIQSDLSAAQEFPWIEDWEVIGNIFETPELLMNHSNISETYSKMRDKIVEKFGSEFVYFIETEILVNPKIVILNNINRILYRVLNSR